MIRKIKFHPEARKEIQHETRFYRQAGQRTGNRFIEATKKASEQLQDNPAMWPSMTERLRGNILSQFPFTIIYAFNEDTIFIVAFAHHRKEPGYWRDRVKEIPFQ